MKEKPKCSVMHSLCRGTKKSFLFFLFCMILFSAANINQCLRRKHQKKRGETDTFETPTLSLSKGGFEVGEYRLQWSDLALWL